ncbi:hypothetical protein ELB75_06525 [Eikenella corrodens]|uniref:Uncharacterized protein n=1 Tax=Eikenella corrodens TaxID=539 RepID=A0A3S9SJM3_EIKCO|nr:hypothetical protein ELB75_06525 [Eikenella corrodens]
MPKPFSGSLPIAKGYLKIFRAKLNQPLPQQSQNNYSELNLKQYSVVSPCRTICTVCGSPPCPDLNLIHYIDPPPAGKPQAC